MCLFISLFLFFIQPFLDKHMDFFPQRSTAGDGKDCQNAPSTSTLHRFSCQFTVNL